MHGDPEHIASMVDAFRAAYARGAPFREDQALVDELAAESEPVLRALSLAVHGESLHEAYALLHLFCRRAGVLGATPSTTLTLLEALVSALAASAVPVDDAWRRALLMVAFEGYSDGREERVTSELRKSAARGQTGFLLAPRCYVGVLSGPLDSEQVEELLEEWARQLLRLDVQSCALDVSRLECAASESAARGVLGFCLRARSLGVAVFLCSGSGELRERLDALGLARSDATSTVPFESAIVAALAATGQRIVERRIGGAWKFLRGSR